MKKKTFQLALIVGVVGLILGGAWWNFERTKPETLSNAYITAYETLEINDFKTPFGYYKIGSKPEGDTLYIRLGNQKDQIGFNYENNVFYSCEACYIGSSKKIKGYILAYALYLHNNRYPNADLDGVLYMDKLFKKRSPEYKRLSRHYRNQYMNRGSFNEPPSKSDIELIIESLGVKYEPVERNFIIGIFRMGIIFSLIDELGFDQKYKESLMYDTLFRTQR